MAKMDNVALFKLRVRQFVRYFNLINYSVTIEPCPVDDHDYYACVENNAVEVEEQPRTARILYNESLLNTLEPWRVEQIAFHEAIELLLCNLSSWSACRKIKVSQREIDGETHNIIHVLLNTVYVNALKEAKRMDGGIND